MTRQFILMTNSPLIYWILDATAERDTQILMQFIYRNQAIILTIDPAIRLQVLSHNLSRPTSKLTCRCGAQRNSGQVERLVRWILKFLKQDIDPIFYFVIVDDMDPDDLR